MRLHRWGVVAHGIAVGVLVLAPVAAFAAQATPQAILGALSVASRAGFCTEKTQQLGDCEKTTVRCDGGTGSGWSDFVEDRFELVGGSVQAKPPAPTIVTTGFIRQEEFASTETLPLEALDYLRADWNRNRSTAPGPIQKGTCYCACNANDNSDACAGQPAGFPVRSGEGLTYEECTATCAPRAVASDKCSIQPIAPSLVGTPASTAGIQTDAWCFGAAECAEQNGFFEEYAGCPRGGRCYAAEPAITLQIPIGSVTEVQGLSRYVVAAYRYGISIAAVAATVMFVYGAFLYLVGSALTSIGQGKQIMIDAILGMIFVFAATMILRTLNPATTQLDPLKVYLVNTRQFVNVAQCSDLGANTRLAFAGVRPNLTSYEAVASRENAFTLLPSAAECGETYWIDGVENSSCDGTRCTTQGEACISCADADTPGCGGRASDTRVCARVVFAGTIDYVDGRFPTNVELLSVCNFAQNGTDVDAVERGLFSLERTSPDRIGRRLSGQTTNADSAGRASYNFSFTEDDIASAVGDCEERGGFRGAVLGVVYETSVGGVGAVDINDIAILSPNNCRGSRWNGYGNGTDAGDAIFNMAPFASAFACGVRNGNFLDTAGQYWRQMDLQEAAQGNRPILCDFTLTASNAPNDPAETLCR